MTEELPRAEVMVGVLTVGTWTGKQWKQPRHYLVTSDDDARQLVARLKRHEPAGRLSVHTTSLSPSPRVRKEIVDTAARQVAAATAKHPDRRGWLATLQWWARSVLEGTA